MIPLQWYLIVAAAMFAIGVFGLLTRRNAIGVLLSVELMANAVNVNLVAFSRYFGDARGQVFALFAIALTVAEVVIGMALVLHLHRTRKTVQLDQANALQG